MRTGGRRGGAAQGLSYFRRLIALAVLAIVALAAPLPSSGDHWGSVIGRHVIPAAEARKVPSRLHPIRTDFKAPAFAPLPQAPAVRAPITAPNAPALKPPAGVGALPAAKGRGRLDALKDE